MKKLTRKFAVLLTACVVLLCLALPAFAEANPPQRTNVEYMDTDGSTKTISCYALPSTADYYSLEAGEWYALTANSTVGNRIDNNAPADNPAHLVLCDGNTLTAIGGIHNEAGKGLVIYGQAAGSGLLSAEEIAARQAAIGGNDGESGGSITIVGGTVTTYVKNSYVAGIGGGYWSSGGEITILGGTVTTKSGPVSWGNAAGLGAGNNGSGGIITIKGGVVSAAGSIKGPGISGEVFISGGKVTAYGQDAQPGITGKISISGGEVIASNNDGSSDKSASGIDGELTISGGKVTAYGRGDCPGISGTLSIGGGEITAVGGADKPGIGGNLVYGKIPTEVKAGASKDSANTIDVEAFKTTYEDYHYAYIKYVKAQYTVRHMTQKEPDGTEYEPRESETLHEFIGNDTEAAAKEYVGFNALDITQKKVAADNSTVVEVKYDRGVYSISFDMNGHGVAPRPIKAIFGSAISAPKDPSEQHYLFEGWYTDKACTQPYRFGTMPGENLTLYAKWEAEPLERKNVSYVDTDGSVKTASCLILSPYQDKFELSAGEWYSIESNTNIPGRIENQGTIENPAHLILPDAGKLEAAAGIHNEKGKSLQIYGQNNGTGELIATAPSHLESGIGGNDGEDGGELTINGATIYATGAATPVGTAYATGIGGGNDGGAGNITINGGTIVATAKGSYGYSCGIGEGDRGSGGTITINGGTVIATGGGSQGAGIGATVVFGKEPIELKAGASSESSENIEADEFGKSNKSYKYAYITYAEHALESTSYTVVHLLQEAVGSNVYVPQEPETLIGIVGENTKAAAREYAGYKARDIMQKRIAADNSTTIEIKYDLIYSTIAFDVNGHGTAPNPIKAVPGTKITAPANPAEEGYIFKGWYLDKECTTEYTFNIMPEKDVTLYAKWIEQNNSNLPLTGDKSHPLLWLIFLIAAAGALCASKAHRPSDCSR